jgi:hypothetical protein
MGLNINADALRGQGPPMSPECRPCLSGEHHKCATVLGPEYADAFDTTYRCPCYFQDQESHQSDYDLAQADREFNRTMHPLFDERPHKGWDD